ncbi:MAG: carboxypeptidase-like regulatory domain-containing protein [Planctomycetota bacterium]|nr:carboxypeptidase-like regulatory domain-containing protein [Planctomycetota bacterium]
MLIGAAAAVFFAAGCGSEVELGGVDGRVTMDGQPLPDALVRFNPEQGGRPAQGITDADGRYTLDYSANSEGALVGVAKVMITTGSLEAPDREPVPKRYNLQSELRADVQSGNNTFDFDLQSK